MMAMPRYLTPDGGCPSVSNILYNGQQVNMLGGFICCLQKRCQEAPVNQTSHV